MGEETRQRIIEAGAELVHRQGFNNTGLKDILKASGVPKGSFYFYFANKEAFGIELIEHYGAGFRALVQPIMQNPGLSPLARLRAVFDIAHAAFAAQGYARGCPIGNLAQEMGDLSEPFRTSLGEALDRMTGFFAALLAQAREAGEVPADLDAEEAAVFLVSAWHGAIIRMKITKDGAPLRTFMTQTFDRLLHP